MKAVIANPAKRKATRRKATSTRRKATATRRKPARKNPSLLVVNPKRKPRRNPSVDVADALLSFLATGGAAIVSAYGIDRLMAYIDEKADLGPWITNGGALFIGGATAVGNLVMKGPALVSGSGLGIAVRGGSGLIDEIMQRIMPGAESETDRPTAARQIPGGIAPGGLRGGIEPAGLLSLVEYEYNDDPATVAALAGLIG